MLYTAKKHLADKSPALGLYAAAVASAEVFFVFALCKYKPLGIAVLALLLEATASLTSAVLQYVSLYDLISYGGWFPATSAAPYWMYFVINPLIAAVSYILSALVIKKRLLKQSALNEDREEFFQDSDV